MTDKSLFSLEIICDKLYIYDKVNCKFPVISFKFLNFPQIVIQHVDNSTADLIRMKLKSEKNYDFKKTFRDLRDEDNVFDVKSGKSCLFTSELKSLSSQLHCTPLYTLVTDNFTEMPILVANCSIRLDEAIDTLSVDIERDGISQPCTVSLPSTPYQIYNAMGDRVGTISVAVRLISLGGNLLAHVPRLDGVHNSLVTSDCCDKLISGEDKENKCTSDNGEQVKIIGEYKTITKTEDGIDELKDKSILTQTEGNKENVIKSVNIATQISCRLKKKERKKLPSDDQDDIGLVCEPRLPPALLYNNDNEYSLQEDLSMASTYSQLEQSDLQVFEEKKSKHRGEVVPILKELLKEFKYLRMCGNIGKQKASDLDQNVVLGKPCSIKDEIISKEKPSVKPVNVKQSKKVNKKATCLSVPSHSVVPIKRRAPAMLQIHPSREIKKQNPRESNVDFLRRISKPKHHVVPFVRDSDDPIVVNTCLPQGHVICGETKSQKLRMEALQARVEQKQRNLQIMYPNVKKKEMDIYLGLKQPEIVPNSTKKERKPKTNSAKISIQRKPIPTPRHSIGNLSEKIKEDNEYNSETHKSKQEVVKEKLNLFEKDRLHFNSKSEKNIKNERLDEAVILKVIREVMVERAMRKHNNEEESKESNESEYSYCESYSDDLEQVSNEIEEKSTESIGNLSDLEIYHQTFTDSSDAVTISESESHEMKQKFDSQSFISTKSENIKLSILESDSTIDSISDRIQSDISYSLSN